MSRSGRFLIRLGRFFGRDNKKEGTLLDIQDKRISSRIEDWLGALYWKPSAFESILSQAGIELPAVLSDYDDRRYNFVCTTSEGKKYNLHISYAYCEDFHEISVTDGDEVRNYELWFNYYNDENPIITLIGHKFTSGDKTITGYYTFWYSWEVKYGNHDFIRVSIKVPRNYRIDAQKCREAEEYLLALEFGFTVDTRNIYETIIDKLSLSSETVESCETISVIYSKKTENDWSVKGKIIVEYGYIKEYQLFQKGNIFHVYSNGNWECIVDGVKITSDDDIITVSITGNTDKIASSNPYSLLQQAEYVIGLLYESVW